MEKNRPLQVLGSILVWATIFLVSAIPLFFWPKQLSTSYPLIWIYLVPKTVLLRIGVMILEYLGLILLLVYLGIAVYKKQFSFKISWVDLLLVAFIGLLWFSAQYSLNKGQALYGSNYWLEGFYTYVNYAALFFIARIFGKGRSLVKLSYALIVTTIIISLYAIVEAFYPGVQAFTNVGLTGRSGATAGNAVILGAYLIMPLALIGGLLAQKIYKGVWAAPAIAAIGLGAIAMVFTYSRGAWFALVLVFFILSLRAGLQGVRWTRKQQLAAAVIMLIAMIVVALGPRPPQTVVARAFSAFNPSEPTVQTRLDAWRQAGRLISRFPLWGTGIDNFSEAVTRMSPQSLTVPLDKPHNFFLEMPATMGIPAFIAFMAVLGLVFYAGVKMVRLAKSGHEAVMSGLAAAGGYLLALFFLFSTINNAPLFYLILGLIAAAARDADALPIIRFPSRSRLMQGPRWRQI